MVQSSLPQVSGRGWVDVIASQPGTNNRHRTQTTSMKARFGLAICAAMVSTVISGCRSGEKTPSDSSGRSAGRDSAGGSVAATAAVPRSPDAPPDSAKRPPNNRGRIPVVEYHLIGNAESRWGRTGENFRKDMQLLYDRGYRPITIAQMLDKDFSAVPAGMSPVVFVFDDASPGQFRYVERNGSVEIDPTSAVGIWLDFAKTHPDWKGKAVFCMLNGGEAGHNFFGDKPKFDGQKNEWRHRKVKWLADNGFELCNHTLWHAQLSKYSDAVVQEQIARNNLGIDSAAAGYRVRTFALPLGVWPKNRELAKRGSWTDPKSGKVVTYNFDAVLEVSGGPTRSPHDPQFNALSINRIEVFGDELRKVLDQLDRTNNRFVR
jgi:hypothetical protein